MEEVLELQEVIRTGTKEGLGFTAWRTEKN